MRWLLLLGVLGLVPAIDAAVALVNHIVTRGFRATLLPALELRGGIPVDLRTLVAVPMLLTSLKDIEEQIERLEIHYLASPGGDLHFALLSDWRDAPSEHVDGDEALLAAAKEGIARLNQRHGPTPGGDRFLLLHRQRVWNGGEGCWIGWERKRGKLRELNRLLRGAHRHHIPEAPRRARERPLRDHARRGHAAPARNGRAANRQDGASPQPAASGRCPGSSRRRLRSAAAPGHASSAGGAAKARSFCACSRAPLASIPTPPRSRTCTRTSSAKALTRARASTTWTPSRRRWPDACPNSTLLSHDLFEGIFARAGLASDVEVVEDFPARYDVAALRHHRWARGDWQLLPWIVGRGPSGAARRSPVPAIGRWKMLDNLRRSLSPPSVVLALIGGWAMPFDDAAVWTGLHPVDDCSASSHPRDRERSRRSALA